MKKTVVLIDDDVELVELLSNFFKDNLYFGPEIKAFYRSKEALDCLLNAALNDDFIYAVIDRNIDGESSGLKIAKELNEKKVGFSVMSGDCSVSFIKILSCQKHCRNVFQKKPIHLLMTQLIKDIENAYKEFIYLNKGEKTKFIYAARGILSERNGIKGEESLRRMQSIARKRGLEVETLARGIIQEQEDFCK